MRRKPSAGTAASRPAVPAQSQLLGPLLATLHAAGGAARPGAIYDALAERIGLDEETRRATVKLGAKAVSLFEHQVRWTRQTAVAKQLIDRGERGIWALTDRANAHLHNIVRGTIVTVFESTHGFLLWANAEDAVAAIERESIDLIFTSPPYPLTKPKAYQTFEDRSSGAWIEKMLRLASGWRELLTPSGSMMINLGPTWEPGEPRQSTYIERFLIRLEDELGLYLCQRLAWESKTKLPTPLEWVGIRRVRVKETTEPILWVAPDPTNVHSDNRRVLRPYSKSGRRAIERPDTTTTSRPAGYRFGPTSFRDAGGAIPPALIATRAAAQANAEYYADMRTAGEAPHPATMPIDVAEWCIRFATREREIVYDPFAGSGTSLVAAQQLNRRWIGSERSHTYCRQATLRLSGLSEPTETASRGGLRL